MDGGRAVLLVNSVTALDSFVLGLIAAGRCPDCALTYGSLSCNGVPGPLAAPGADLSALATSIATSVIAGLLAGEWVKKSGLTDDA